jgi:hypothetical protein
MKRDPDSVGGTPTDATGTVALLKKSPRIEAILLSWFLTD